MTAAADRSGLALLGGAFDPPHATHRRLAAAALERLPVAELLVLPAGDHPHKAASGLAPAAQRLQMCRLAFAAMPGVVVDDRELRRPGPSYTVDTLLELRAEHPGRQLFLLLGADNVAQLPTWYEHHRILQLATVAVFPRGGVELRPELLAGLDLTAAERQALLGNVLPFAADATASRELRQALRLGRDVGEQIDAAVLQYIRSQHLYGT